MNINRTWTDPPNRSPGGACGISCGRVRVRAHDASADLTTAALLRQADTYRSNDALASCLVRRSVLYVLNFRNLSVFIFRFFSQWFFTRGLSRTARGDSIPAAAFPVTRGVRPDGGNYGRIPTGKFYTHVARATGITAAVSMKPFCDGAKGKKKIIVKPSELQ